MNNSITACAVSDIGVVRSTNQDNFYIGNSGPSSDFVMPSKVSVPYSTDSLRAVFGVFDGMGGEHCGGEAAAATSQTFEKHYLGQYGPEPELSDSFYVDAHDAVHKIQQAEGAMSGTTAVTLVIDGGVAHVTNMGDSKIYMVRGKKIICLTEDHTLAALMVRQGLLSPEEADKSLGKGKLTRFVGAHSDECDVTPFHHAPIALKQDDMFLLCSDGVTDGLSSDAILSIMLEGGGCEKIAAALVEGAIKGGSRDNCTAMVVTINYSPAHSGSSGTDPFRKNSSARRNISIALIALLAVAAVLAALFFLVRPCEGQSVTTGTDVSAGDTSTADSSLVSLSDIPISG